MVISRRLKEVGLDQRGLARAAEVTESYISQLLSGKRPLPAASRTDIYEKMSRFLKLPAGELARLTEVQRREGLKRVIGEQPRALHAGVRELILRKCHRRRVKAVAAIFEGAPFGELERLVTQKLLEVAKEAAAQGSGNAAWLRALARATRRSYRQVRVHVVEFLELSAIQVSVESCTWLLDPLIDAWDIDLATFDLTIRMNGELDGGQVKRFGFVRKEADTPATEGFRRFLHNATLSETASEEEIRLLERLTFPGRRPTALFYYRELQNLRDPLHFES